MTPTRWKRAVNATAQLDFGQLLPALTQAWPRGTRPASPEAHNWQIRAPLCTPDSRDPAAPIRRSAYVKVRIRLTVGDQHCLRGRTAPGRGSIHPVSQERSPVAGWHLRHSAPGESDCEPDHVSCRARRTLDETCCPGICGCHMRGAKRAPVRVQHCAGSQYEWVMAMAWLPKSPRGLGGGCTAATTRARPAAGVVYQDVGNHAAAWAGRQSPEASHLKIARRFRTAWMPATT